MTDRELLEAGSGTIRVNIDRISGTRKLSDRELELLAVIEQKDEAIKVAIARTIRRLYETCPECDTSQKCNETKACCMCKNVEPELTIALALTPESALKEK